MLGEQYSCSEGVLHRGQYKHCLQHNTHGQDVHFDIAGDAVFKSERGNTELRCKRGYDTLVILSFHVLS